MKGFDFFRRKINGRFKKISISQFQKFSSANFGLAKRFHSRSYLSRHNVAFRPQLNNLRYYFKNQEFYDDVVNKIISLKYLLKFSQLLESHDYWVLRKRYAPFSKKSENDAKTYFGNCVY